MDPQPGVSATVTQPSAERLRKALEEERELVRRKPMRQRPTEVF
jgi:hypothetical protein